MAVKVASGGQTLKAESEIVKELQVMKQVGNHANVVSLLGVCEVGSPVQLGIVTDFMARGSLDSVLKKHPDKFGRFVH